MGRTRKIRNGVKPRRRFRRTIRYKSKRFGKKTGKPVGKTKKMRRVVGKKTRGGSGVSRKSGVKRGFPSFLTPKPTPRPKSTTEKETLEMAVRKAEGKVKRLMMSLNALDINMKKDLKDNVRIKTINERTKLVAEIEEAKKQVGLAAGELKTWYLEQAYIENVQMNQIEAAADAVAAEAAEKAAAEKAAAEKEAEKAKMKAADERRMRVNVGEKTSSAPSRLRGLTAEAADRKARVAKREGWRWKENPYGIGYVLKE